MQMQLEASVARIRGAYCCWHDAVKHQQQIDRELESMVANALGYMPTMEPDERKEMFAVAQKVVKAVSAGEPSPVSLNGQREMVEASVAAMELPRTLFDAKRREARDRMVDVVPELPVWSWVEGIRGFGAKGLGKIIGECGDLNDYPNPSKLWKWCCLHVSDDGEAGQDGDHERKAIMLYHVADPLVKQGNGYKLLYRQRRANKSLEPYRDVPPDPWSDAEPRPDWTKGHYHADALRYVAKRLLRDLWRAWRGLD